MKAHDFPVVISGAGPAGSVASLFLSDFGIPHLLLDKCVFPRDKICGDAVSGKMLEILARLKEEEVSAFGYEKEKAFLTPGMEFVAPNGKGVGIPFPPSKGKQPIGFVSKRLAFDHFVHGLTESPHCTSWQGVELINVKRENGGLRLTIDKDGEEHTITTPLVIGADGSRSVVRKKLQGDEVDENHYCAGIRAYYSNVAGMHPEGYLELHFIKELLPGYLWIFPLPNNQANVGLGMLSRNVSRHKVNLRKELEKILQTHPQLRARFSGAELQGKIQGWGLPLGSKRRPLTGDNFILTGDAASLIDPFTGEGIGNAGVSGMVAARMAKKAIEFNNYSHEVLKEYDATIYGKLWSELQLSHRIQQLSSVPWLFNFVVNRIASSDNLRRVFTNMFIDLDLRAELKNPLFYLRLLRKSR